MPYYIDNSITIYNKDCRSMDELSDNSIQCVVTSPPYWGLRKYSGEQELVWGDNHCEHQWVDKQHKDTRGVEGSNLTGRIPYKEGEARINYTDGHCSLCGAWKGSYGLEPTPELYIQHTIEILREIRRVLRKDGVVFWNIGDSYSGSGQDSGKVAGQQRAGGTGIDTRSVDIVGVGEPVTRVKHNILKPKDLCLIPFKVAIAAQEDGWWVRSVIIWNKPNPMPESVQDRPTESHEYILMLTKSSKYYWDADAVREPHTWIENRPSGMERQAGAYRDKVKGFTKDQGGGGSGFVGHSGGMKANGEPLNNPLGRNIRSVWEFPTQPFPSAHFAVFPEKLPEICIKAATPEVGGCSKCGSPWERIVDRKTTIPLNRIDYQQYGNPDRRRQLSGPKLAQWKANNPDVQLGWQPTCKCNADKVPSIVLDPFSGAGTTLWVAKKLGRKAVGYDISAEYCELGLDRNRQQVLGV